MLSRTGMTCAAAKIAVMVARAPVFWVEVR